jgi:putative membrane-bound dehydrogenase-like protein
MLICLCHLAAQPPQPGTHVIPLDGHNFTLPVGFAIERVAGPPLVDRPITADFDEEGRLYVGDSSGSNEKVEVQLEKKPHRIVRLEDTDGDGKFDKRTIFADKMMFPEGTMWYTGSLYVAAPPSIWKLTDTDGDGVADQRVEWFQGMTLTGCANDLHGPYLGPDGWIYWCKGAFAKQTYSLTPLSPLGGEGPGVRGSGPSPAPTPSPQPSPPRGERVWSTRAAHIFRARPDGTGIEPVMTGGMDNPVGLAFMPEGERIFTTTFLQHPGGGKRDGLIHALYGGVYGKDHDVIYDHPWTGPQLLPPLVHLGAAAPAGLCRYESESFGKEYKDNLFAACFNMKKVTRHVLRPKGATYEAATTDFLVSDNKDFHPTDVLEAADGSFLIVDTGGWYKLCCPTSQLHKPDVLGAIYRVKKLGASRQHAKPARPPLPRLYMIALNRDAAGFGEAVAGLRQTNLHTRRLAAEALGRIGNPEAVPELLEALTKPDVDRALEHSLIYALLEIGDREVLLKATQSDNLRIRRAALIALDQIKALDTPKVVASELNAPDPAMKEAASWIILRHPEWGDALAGHLRQQLAGERTLTPSEQAELAMQLARFAKSAAVEELIATHLGNEFLPKDRKLVVLRAVAQSGVKQSPKAWLAGIIEYLKRGSSELRREALLALRALPLSKQPPAEVGKALLAVASDVSAPIELRLQALAAVPGGMNELHASLFELILRHLDAEQPVVTRSAAAEAMSKAKLNAEQLATLAGTLKNVGPMELARVLEPFVHSSNAAVGSALLKGIRESPARTALRVEQLRPKFAKQPVEIQREAEALYASLDADLTQQKAKLEKLLATLEPGDIRRGQIVFNSTKAACSSCHAIGYLGGNIGPDLTRIGGIRTERDLLESIVFPSVSFVQSYEPVIVLTKDGRVHNGLVKKDTSEELLLATGADQFVRIPREDIEDLKPSRVSIMPAGLDQQLTPRDLADLVAFLKGCR